jgi:hypothetical protein
VSREQAGHLLDGSRERRRVRWIIPRVAVVSGAATLALAMSAAFADGQSSPPSARPAAARPDESVIVSVPATAPWTDTGIVVRAGDRLDFRAWGRVTYGKGEDSRAVAPVGSGRGGGCGFAVTDGAIAADAVVANIAPAVTFDGRGFHVGASRTVTLPVAAASAQEGRLFVGVNHQGISCDRSGYDSWEFRNNGFGAFTVEIAVRRRK